MSRPRADTTLKEPHSLSLKGEPTFVYILQLLIACSLAVPIPIQIPSQTDLFSLARPSLAEKHPVLTSHLINGPSIKDEQFILRHSGPRMSENPSPVHSAPTMNPPPQ